MQYDRDGLTGKASGVSKDIVYDDMNNRLFSSTTQTPGQEVLNVGKAIQLSKISAKVGRAVIGAPRRKIASWR